MRDKHLRECLREHWSGYVAGEAATTTSDPGGLERRENEGEEDRGVDWEQTMKERVVELIQTTFQDSVIAEEATWKAILPIQEGGRDYHVIGLMEVVW